MADNPQVNSPDSGTYGAVADLENLKKALPQGAVGNPAPSPTPPSAPPIGTQPIQPISSTQGRPLTGGAAPPGIPSAVLSPSHPMLASPPATTNPLAGAANGQQARLALLQALINSPQTSATTKAWAQEVTQVLLGGKATMLTPAQPQGGTNVPPG